MARKRKTVYPPSRSSKGAAPAPRVPMPPPPTLAVIDVDATRGRAGITPGMRVTIVGNGSAAGGAGTVQSLVGGVIPAALVLTDSGLKRRVRTVDLVPLDADRGPTPSA